MGAPDVAKAGVGHAKSAPTPTPPALSNKLAVLYAKAESKIEAAAKKRKSSKADATLLAKFQGKMPPSLLRVLAGEIVAPNTGFHKIALQAAITANALGWTEEQLLAACEGVVEKHQSDGTRYNTPAWGISWTTGAFFGLLGARVS
jgi:hypothetical protein